MLNLTLTKVVTADGTETFYVKELDEHYHSLHGARKESQYVFILNGLEYYLKKNTDKRPVNILEVGLGTGLNALLTYISLYLYRDSNIYYEAIEPYPLGIKDIYGLNYSDIFSKKIKDSFIQLHTCNWAEDILISNQMIFRKEKVTFRDFDTTKKYDIVYFDAFAPDKQPDMWTKDVFLKLYTMMTNGGVLVTYCAKGEVKRKLKATGFSVEALSGPPGKREMIRATKNPL